MKAAASILAGNRAMIFGKITIIVSIVIFTVSLFFWVSNYTDLENMIKNGKMDQIADNICKLSCWSNEYIAKSMVIPFFQISALLMKEKVPGALPGTVNILSILLFLFAVVSYLYGKTVYLFKNIKVKTDTTS